MNERLRIPPIELVVETAADAETAWRTLTEPSLVNLWFTDASPLGGVGSRYRLDFGDGSVVAGEVLAVEPDRSFAYAWAWESGEPGEITRVIQGKFEDALCGRADAYLEWLDFVGEPTGKAPPEPTPGEVDAEEIGEPASGTLGS